MLVGAGRDQLSVRGDDLRGAEPIARQSRPSRVVADAAALHEAADADAEARACRHEPPAAERGVEEAGIRRAASDGRRPLDGHASRASRERSITRPVVVERPA